MPSPILEFRKKIIVCTSDFYIYRELQLGLADFRNDHTSWAYIVDECWPDHCYQGRQGDAAVVSMMSSKIVDSWKAFHGHTVNVSHSLPQHDVPSVYSDDLAVGHVAAEHFLERNFEHFAFLGKMSHAHCIERMTGFENGLKSAGSPSFRVSIYEPLTGTDFFNNLFSKRLMDWLDALPKPVAVFVQDDVLATRLIEFLLNNGLEVPDDVAVLGVNDDKRICMMAPVALSSVSLDGYRMGYRAGEMLNTLLSGGTLPHEVERIPPQPVTTRQSTDMVASLDPVLRRGIIFIRHHLADQISVEDISRYAGCSRRVLERHFREHFGHGPYEEILRSRISRAKQYLAHSPKTVEQISVICGFSEPNLFYTQFRKREGTSPRSWRRQQHTRNRDAVKTEVSWSRAKGTGRV